MNRLKKQVFNLFFLIVLLIGEGQLYARELVLNDDFLFQYAGHLYRNGEYYRAVTEYKRLLYFFPDSRWVGDSRLQIGRAYMAGEQLSEAIDYWNTELSENSADDGLNNRYKILFGISLLDLNRSKTFSLRKQHIDSAMEVFSEINPIDEDSRLIRSFSTEWRNLPESDSKVPWLAGTMSAVLPGSGSAYSGRYREAVYAFFLTGLFAIATADAIRHDDTALTGVFGFFTLVFYGGNIYTAVNSAYKYNDWMKAEDLRLLRKKYGIWFIPETDRRKGRF